MRQDKRRTKGEMLDLEEGDKKKMRRSYIKKEDWRNGKKKDDGKYKITIGEEAEVE